MYIFNNYVVCKLIGLWIIFWELCSILFFIEIKLIIVFVGFIFFIIWCSLYKNVSLDMF